MTSWSFTKRHKRAALIGAAAILVFGVFRAVTWHIDVAGQNRAVYDKMPEIFTKIKKEKHFTALLKAADTKWDLDPNCNVGRGRQPQGPTMFFGFSAPPKSATILLDSVAYSLQKAQWKITSRRSADGVNELFARKTIDGITVRFGMRRSPSQEGQFEAVVEPMEPAACSVTSKNAVLSFLK